MSSTAIGWRQPGATAVEGILRRANRELMCAIEASLLDGRQIPRWVEADDPAHEYAGIRREPGVGVRFGR